MGSLQRSFSTAGGRKSKQHSKRRATFLGFGFAAPVFGVIKVGGGSPNDRNQIVSRGADE
jgi:hypothetical protein